MQDIKKQDIKNRFDLIRYEAQERQRLEAERRQKIKEMFNHSKSSNPLDRINGEKK
jgi:hypothetical protein